MMSNMSAFIIFIYGLLLVTIHVHGSNQDVSMLPGTEGAIGSLIQGLLEQIQDWQTASVAEKRPFVTLTFAQSMDGKIALYLDDDRNETSSNLPISGPESMLMTHALRCVHDAILVGGRTLATDNPRLTNRLWGMSDHQPRPVVLDSELRHVRKLLNSGKKIRAKDLIVCCSRNAASSCQESARTFTLLPCEVDANGQLDLTNVLERLHTELGVTSVMVEGGSALLSSFVRRCIVDCLCVAISPKVIGTRGLPAFALDGCRNVLDEAVTDCLDLPEARFCPLGKDFILLSRWNA